MKLIECKNLNYFIGYKQILKNINFHLNYKELCLLLGENGSGKSVLFKTLLCYYNYPSSYKYSQKSFNLSYMGHQLGIYTSLSLKENLDYFKNILPNVEEKRIINLLDIFNLTKKINEPVFTFSQGMKQKVSLIRCLMMKADLYLLDEPYTSLDKKTKAALDFYLENLKKESCIFAISHEDFKENLEDRKIYITKGKIENNSDFTQRN